MKKNTFLLLFVILALYTRAQDYSGDQLLDKAIEYHDPTGAWPSFRGVLSITMQSPGKSDRVSEVVIDLPARYFKLSATTDDITTTQIIDRGQCTLSLNGNADFSEDDAKSHGLNCDRARSIKNYYTYLYGLPMKLRDPGTIIDPIVHKKTFEEKEYLVLKVTYDKTVGGDTWYFYFDPATYAMEVYQFYHNEASNDGEYILLSGEERVSGIKMPKTRAWYYNSDDKYLGTDVLIKASGL
ncbi:MAG TPA: DUF6503 family protein [Eudoraea sp.]|nr:DUF6503 family protein [Eudoraea sp.]